MIVNRAGLLRRTGGVAFWIMILLSFVFITYSYATAQTVEWLLVLVILIAGLIFRVAGFGII